MRNARLPLSEELHDLVRDAIEDLGSAAGAGDPGIVAPILTPPTGAERRRARQARILRLRLAAEGPTAPPVGASPPPSAAVADPPPPPPPAQPHRQRAFLAHLDVASTVFSPRIPVRTRRLAVACRRASPLDAARVSRMLRIAVPAVAIDPRSVDPPRPVRSTAVLPAAPAAPAAPPSRPPQPLETSPPAAPKDVPAERDLPQVLAADLPDARLTRPPEVVEAALPAILAASTLARARVETVDGTSRWRGRLGHAANLIIAIALEIVVMVCVTMVGLIVTGHHLEEVVTGSMQPTIPIGALVLTERIPADQLAVGDVLVFPNPNNTTLTIVHRIVWLSHDQQGDVLIKTKGDYNAVDDNWTIKRPGTAYADRAIWVIPGGGIVATWLRAIGFFGLLSLIIGFIGYQGWRQVRKVMVADHADGVPAPAVDVAS
jgi:signal peptidase